jgi:hypothetical protein
MVGFVLKVGFVLTFVGTGMVLVMTVLFECAVSSDSGDRDGGILEMW